MRIQGRKALQAGGPAFAKALNGEWGWYVSERTRNQNVWSDMDEEEQGSG